MFLVATPVCIVAGPMNHWFGGEHHRTWMKALDRFSPEGLRGNSWLAVERGREGLVVVCGTGSFFLRAHDLGGVKPGVISPTAA